MSIPGGIGRPPSRSASHDAKASSKNAAAKSDKARGKQRQRFETMDEEDGFEAHAQTSQTPAGRTGPADTHSVSPKAPDGGSKQGVSTRTASAPHRSPPLNREIFADAQELAPIRTHLSSTEGVGLTASITALQAQMRTVGQLYTHTRAEGWASTPEEQQKSDLDTLEQALSGASHSFFELRDHVEGLLERSGGPHGAPGDAREALAHRLCHTLIYPQVLDAAHKMRFCSNVEVETHIERQWQRLDPHRGTPSRSNTPQSDTSKPSDASETSTLVDTDGSSDKTLSDKKEGAAEILFPEAGMTPPPTIWRKSPPEAPPTSAA